MSGTDDLFPDATQHPGAAVPPGASGPLGAGMERPSTVAPRRRGIGVAAFILGALALLGDLIGIIVAGVTLAGTFANLGSQLTNIDNSLGSLIGVIVVEFLVFFGGVLFGLLAVIIGIVAAVRNRGRAFGIFGVIFGLIVLISHVGLGVVIATSGNVPGVTS